MNLKKKKEMYRNLKTGYLWVVMLSLSFIFDYIFYQGKHFFQEKTHHIIVQIGRLHVRGKESGIP